MADSKSLGTATGSRIHYEGGRNITYDLSGTDTRFEHQDTIVVFNTNQVHNFVIPVYIQANGSSQQVFKVERLTSGTLTTGDGEWVEVPRDDTKRSGWSPVEIDVPSMSQAYLMASDFAGQLVKSIQINILGSAANEKIYVRITYQRFYQDLYDWNGFDGIGPSYTPSLGKYILDELQEMKAQIAQNIENTFSVSDNVNDMLEEDLTGVLPANYVQDEAHEVETLSGIDTIMPARGSFYEHDFRMWKYSIRTGTVQMANKQYNLENQSIFLYQVVSNVGGSSTKITTTKRVYLTEDNYDNYLGMAGSFIDRSRMSLLVKGVDYEFTNLNTPKTQKSESEYGVYDTIRLLKAFTGRVLITYHAFGGAVVFEDVKDMRQDILNAMKILSSKNLVTSDILDKQPVIKELLNRMLVVEQYHNHFNRVEHAVYMGMTGFHWFNIAELYDVAWGEELSVIDEIGMFRVESVVRGWCYEFGLTVDLKQKLVNALRCKTIATNDILCSDLKDYIAYLDGRDDVAIRVCWVGDGTKSGVMLQLGWNFRNYPDPINGVDNDTIIVTNKSGMTSKWRLVYNPLDNTYDSPSSKHVCNHTTYAKTSDDQWQSNKDYFRFESIYTYYRTASETVRQDIQYYTITTNASEDATVYTAIQMTVGYDIADYVSGKYDAYDMKREKKISCKNGIYERALYKKVPRIIEKTSYTPGTKIPDDDKDNIFEPSSGSYSEDDGFLMPSTAHYWVSGTEGCYQIRRVLEPSEGFLAWAGNVPLSAYNAKTLVLNSILHPDTQDNVEIMTIKGLSLKLYDRKMNKIISRRADVGYCEAQYDSAIDSEQEEPQYAVEGVKYYERTGDGSITNPYKYYRSTINTGSRLIKGTYFVLGSPDKIIGQIIFDLLDLCGAKLEIYKSESDGYIHFAFDSYIGTDSYINHRFDLRQIELHF